MPCYLCSTCGVQYAESVLPPEECRVCTDERQYVGWSGQHWTTVAELRTHHTNVFRTKWPDLVGMATAPKFAIGQRALVVRDPGFGVVWDCISLVDEVSVSAVLSAGRIRAIAISHPHFYAAMVDWSGALGGVPIYLHAADREWVMRPDPAIVFWEGETLALADGLTLIRCGGHFDGSTVLHWAGGAQGRGVLLTGDTLHVGEDRASVSFMRSYPNYIPLDAEQVRRIAAAVEPYPFEQLYGAFWDRNILAGAKDAVRRSAERYVRAIGAR
jgi:hypothetical protein